MSALLDFATPGLRRAVPVEIEVGLTLRGPLALRLVEAADQRSMPVVELFAELVETILADNLVGSILDD